jgi:hypothetical protein
MKAPELLRTFDGAEWELRSTTQTGTALYAVKGSPKCCPPYVMATLTELAEHGIQSAELAAAVAELGALPVPAGNATQPQPLTVFRASHDALTFGLYSTPAAAREHCEQLIRRDVPANARPDFLTCDWIEDEEDGVAELVITVDGLEEETGYIVTALDVAHAYDQEADE